MKIQHVVIPSDLSAEGQRPCTPMVAFAQELGARITLLHVVQDLRFVPHGAPFAPIVSMPEVSKELESARAQLAAQAKSMAGGMDVTVDVIAAENVAKGICAYALEHGADLIALSTHGRTGFRHLALGSVAEATLRHSAVPVLVFPRVKD